MNEHSKKTIKVTITGAAGHIGYALLFRIASGQMFGANTPVELQCLELERGLPGLNGVAMELDDCAFPLLKNIVCTADVNEAMSGANWVILVGAVPRKTGMERSDLLEINGKIFTTQGRAINENAADDVRVLVVGNPCNTNALITMHHAPDIPNDRFFAMTMLDELRARAQLAKRAGVAITDVHNMTIWGNHSATQYPDFYNARINGKSALEVIGDEPWLQNDFVKLVQQRGAEVIKARGSSSAASAANAIIRTVNALTNNTQEGESFSIVRCSQGEYNVDEGLLFSFPCEVADNQLRVIHGLAHNTYGQEKINATLDELRQEKETVQQLGLIE